MANTHALSIAPHQIQPDSVVGLGSDTALTQVALMLPGIRNRLRDVAGGTAIVATQLKAKGVPLIALDHTDSIDIYFDCAKEATPSCCLNKGSDPSLARARVMADLTHKFVCVIDQAGLVERLGEQPFAVEVLPIARKLVANRLATLGASALWEEGVITDNGNLLFNAGFPEGLEAWALKVELDRIPGIVANSIFSRRPANLLILTTGTGAEIVGPCDLKQSQRQL